MRGSLGGSGGEGIATYRPVRVKEMGCDVGVGDLGDGGLLVDRNKEVVVVSFIEKYVSHV